MSDSNDESDRPDTPRTPPNTEPLRIVGAEEAGTLVGLDDLGDDRSGASGGAERPAGGSRSPAPRPGRRPVFESVPDAVLDGGDLGPVTAGGSWSAASGPFDEEALADLSGESDITVLGPVGTSGRSGGTGVRDDADPSQELELPHWTAPATGQVPRVLVDDTRRDETWSSYASAPRWRDDSSSGWDDDVSGVADLADLADDEPPQGALSERDRPAIDDFFAFDDLDPSDPTPKPRGRGRSGRRGRDGGDADLADPSTDPVLPGPVGAGGGSRSSGRNVPVAVGLGVGLAVVALILFRMGPAPTMVFVLLLLGIGGAEFFDASRRGGYRPATLLGLAATVGLPAAVYWRGDIAFPIVGGLAVMAGLLWFLFGVDQEQVTADLGVTMLGIAYVGGLGSFAALILRTPGVDTTRVLLGAIVPVVASDVFAYVVGRNAGRTPLMPHVSPNKTVEGLVGGALGAVIASLVFNQMLGSNPWEGLGTALQLGLVVAVVAPLGDLAESLIKRDLGIKDMGSILPGHGGVLDRFDALLFTLPAVYYLGLLTDVLPQ